LLATPPTYAPAGETKCGVVASPTRPLVVEWPSADRATLEAKAKDGVVAVHYSGCEMEVLPNCAVPATYEYTPTTMKHDTVHIRDATALYSNLPLGAASLEATLERRGELRVDMTIVGRYAATKSEIAKRALVGAECERATHIIAGLTVGAFDFSAGGEASAAGDVSVIGARVGGDSTATQEKIAEDGDERACGRASNSDVRPPTGCGAPLRVEVVPIGAWRHDCGMGYDERDGACVPVSNVTDITTPALPDTSGGDACTRRYTYSTSPVQSGERAAVIDAETRKLFVVAWGDRRELALRRCNLDGAGCAYSDISAGQSLGSFAISSVMIDPTSRTLIVVIDIISSDPRGERPSVIRCKVDGTSCTYAKLSAGKPSDSWSPKTGAVAAANGKLFVVAENRDDERPALFRCNIDGTDCTLNDMASQSKVGINDALPLIDTMNNKLLVVTTRHDVQINGGGGFSYSHHRQTLVRCNFDGVGCALTDIGADTPFLPGPLAAVIDAASGKLLVAGAAESGPALLRCEVDGTKCTYSAMSTWHDDDERGIFVHAAIDLSSRRLLVATTRKDAGLAFFQCDLDGTACTRDDGSSGAPGASWIRSTLLDPTSGRFFAFVQEANKNITLATFCPSAK
jgi:hypothetical protein